MYHVSQTQKAFGICRLITVDEHVPLEVLPLPPKFYTSLFSPSFFKYFFHPLQPFFLLVLSCITILECLRESLMKQDLCCQQSFF